MTAIPRRIPHLLLMCSSDNDGEALNACRLVGQALKGAGLDWHALAAAVSSQTASSGLGDYQPSRREASAAPPPKTGGFNHTDWPHWREAWARAQRTRSFTPRQEASHRAQAKFCRDEDRGRLNPRERRFVWDIANLHGNLTTAQSDWLAGICDRLEQAEAWTAGRSAERRTTA